MVANRYYCLRNQNDSNERLIMFIGHNSDIELGEFEPVKQLDKKYIFVNEQNAYLLSNVCTHQRSLISLVKGRGESRTCMYHGREFDMNGYCLKGNCDTLEKAMLHEWNTLFFDKPFETPELELPECSVSLVERRTDQVKAHRTSIIDVFLDVEHIQHLHDGVYDQIGIDSGSEITWNYHDWGSTQIVKGHQGTLQAAWLCLYPGTMVEWQSGHFFITVAGKTNHHGYTDVHVYKYRANDSTDENWKLHSDTWEDAWMQDRMQAELIVPDENGFDENLEESKLHYRRWMNDEQ